MFARVSAYRPAPNSIGEPTEETVRRVLNLDGCLGIYYLVGAKNRTLSITLWDSAETIAASRVEADAIRAETSADQQLEILDVEEFEVVTRQLRD